MKRDIVNEINSVKSRSEFDSRHDYSKRMNDIEFAFSEEVKLLRDSNKELLKYIPIATVACYEGFFRSVYKELINFGTPYSENAIKFNQSKNVKFDFEIIHAIQSKTLTTGDFISHILPCNNFNDINSNVSTIMGLDFVEQLKNFKPNSIFDHVIEDAEKFIGNSDLIIADIKRTFELRHIFCHEFSVDFKIDELEIFRCFASSRVFLDHVDNYVWKTLYPNTPETQGDMNMEAYNEFVKTDKDLFELVNSIKLAFKNQYDETTSDKLLDDSLEHWVKYRESRAVIESSGFEGGNMQPQIHYLSMTSITKEKIESLKNQYRYLLKRHASS